MADTSSRVVYLQADGQQEAKRRFVWSQEVEYWYVEAVQNLGGLFKAKAEDIHSRTSTSVDALKLGTVYQRHKVHIRSCRACLSILAAPVKKIAWPVLQVLRHMLPSVYSS